MSEPLYHHLFKSFVINMKTPSPFYYCVKKKFPPQGASCYPQPSRALIALKLWENDK